MEWETNPTCFNRAILVLDRLLDQEIEKIKLPDDWNNNLVRVQRDLNFLKMFSRAMEYTAAAGNDSHHLGSVLKAVGSHFKRTIEEIAAWEEAITAWEEITAREERASSPPPLASLADKIQQLKPQIKECCTVLLGREEESEESVSEYRFLTTEHFIDLILNNLYEVLLSWKKQVVADDRASKVKQQQQQLGTICGQLKLFRDFAKLISYWFLWWRRSDEKDLKKLFFHIRAWADRVACLACLYWIDDDAAAARQASSITNKWGSWLSNLMRKTIPYAPDVTALYLGALKNSRDDNFAVDILRLAQHATRFVDFLLEDVDKNGDIKILAEGLAFLLTFMVDPDPSNFQKMDDKDSVGPELIPTLINDIISDVPSVVCSILSHETKEGASMLRTWRIPDFLEKIDRLKAAVRDTYVLKAHSSPSNSPKTNPLGFLDFLSGNLRKMLESKPKLKTWLKHGIGTIQEELASLRPFLQDVIKLQNEHQDDDEEFSKLRTRIIDVVYRADYVISLFSVSDVPVWYCIICLSNVIQDVKLIRRNEVVIKKFEGHQTYNVMGSTTDAALLPPRATTSRAEGIFVGFKEEARSIIDYLVRGRKDLTIVSISGMPGQGKTTLARRIYNDPAIQYHFHKTVWCHVSQECKTRELLIKIIRDVSNVDFPKKKLHDLVDRLRKALKGKRYLIVMDDIWDVGVWHEVQGSFPNDSNGSRILFTSRNHDLASQASQPNSVSHRLRLFSDEESWELMKEMIFSHDDCPPQLSGIGKQIATYCKGLPLVSVLIASLLGRTKKEPDLWNQVAENLEPYLAREEGCMQIMELSYMHLPDHLKPCFLYFGTFPRGQYIRARKLKLLWIAEGFINKNEKQCSEDLAKEYLDNLVSQSLVVITERSSDGGIKTCGVHDLLYDMCLQKASEEKFLQMADAKAVADLPRISVPEGAYLCNAGSNQRLNYKYYYTACKYDHYRLCIVTKDPFTRRMPVCTREELPAGQVRSLLSSEFNSGRPTDSSFLMSFKTPTVLDLEGMFLNDNMLPKPILSLVDLRYLAIWARIETVPASIADLWNLETVIIKGSTFGVKLPETMLEMKSLRHVNIDSSAEFAFSMLDQSSSFPSSSTVCSNMETFGSLDLHCNCNSQQLLMRLLKLRKLKCTLVEESHPWHASWFSTFKSLNQLETLSVYNAGNMFGVTNDEFPGFSFLPVNLKKLAITCFRLPWSALSSVGQMPNLEVLKLEYDACMGKTWDLGDGEFSKLRFLKLRSLDIEEINVSSCSSGPFPRLEELLVQRCRKFEIPSCFGDIDTLESIKVVSSPKAAQSAGEIMEQKRDFGNDSFQVLFESYHDDIIYQLYPDTDDQEDDEEEGCWEVNFE